MEDVKQLPNPAEDLSVVGLAGVEEQQVTITTTTVHLQQYCTNQDFWIPIHKLSHQLERNRLHSLTL